MNDANPVTTLLAAWRDGDESVLEPLSAYVYHELRRLAGRAMEGESAGHTLQPTALVHEAFVRLIQADVDYRGRQHFFAIAARMMRRILVDHARSKHRAKRGGGAVAVTLDAASTSDPTETLAVIELDDALTKLAELDRRAAEVVELVYFGGLSCDETAALLEISRSTVFEELRFAKAWLRDAMG